MRSLVVRAASSRTEMDTKNFPYTVYSFTIDREGESWTIEHRFSEFKRLAESLRQNAVDRGLPPPLPLPNAILSPGLMASSRSPEFVAKRAAGLESYLSELVRTTADSVLLEFVAAKPPETDENPVLPSTESSQLVSDREEIKGSMQQSECRLQWVLLWEEPAEEEVADPLVESVNSESVKSVGAFRECAVSRHDTSSPVPSDSDAYSSFHEHARNNELGIEPVAMRSPKSTLHIGSRVMAAREGCRSSVSEDCWLQARVVSRRLMVGGQPQLKIRYSGYGSEGEEWLDEDSERIQPFGVGRGATRTSTDEREAASFGRHPESSSQLACIAAAHGAEQHIERDPATTIAELEHQLALAQEAIGERDARIKQLQLLSPSEPTLA
mmetsp:Transcript_35909/g.59518  ORF Transcript_35909/g.59518 Transcript_35909/m.59518 type:complete len:383 (+) Transcript_35909:24-1172(+)|eukprot:CAMPEP_0119329182 /NCGR_PEP_ID=MMETSP1333-20130426/75288_1 /TAXON_ID=418940 /ORGANISM="Scyphosphaera apsteinii, Strain RCC1455" /LENGTH=382 /DNA_ID=CAMNT_0007338241 /DNA_START=24 /DNA_END=1172 /DNA_ORIENTATION=+